MVTWAGRDRPCRDVIGQRFNDSTRRTDSFLRFRVLIQHEYAVGREVIIAGERVAGEEIVHGLVELDAHRRILMIEQEKRLGYSRQLRS